jgi:chemotaxis family two-component system response regulator Rcp1
VSPVLRDPIEILLVQDNAVDVGVTRDALRDARVRNRLQVVPDGDEALHLLHRRGAYANAPRPHLILLDLNLPKKTGLEVLAEIKSDTLLKQIAVVLLTTSSATPGLLGRKAGANGYVTKPVDLEQLLNAIRTIDDFWIEIVKVSPL